MVLEGFIIADFKAYKFINLLHTSVFRYLAMVLYHAGDMAGAIMQQHKELIINERCLGLGHPDTAHRYKSFLLFLSYFLCSSFIVRT